jgi:cysteine synthase
VPEGAAFARGWPRSDRAAVATRASCIEGIGRAQVEPCFAFEIVDRVVEVPDAASVAGIRWLEPRTGQRFGGSSGTNAVAALQLACELGGEGKPGSIVMLLCDRGERYADTLYSDAWLAANGLDATAWTATLRAASAHGGWNPPG